MKTRSSKQKIAWIRMSNTHKPHLLSMKRVFRNNQKALDHYLASVPTDSDELNTLINHVDKHHELVSYIKSEQNITLTSKGVDYDNQ